MDAALLSRLEIAVAGLLEKNRRLEQECQQLRRERLSWQQEQSELLAEVDHILARLEKLPKEES
jgi:FtsZ-binding cell division protein ZapB